MQQAREAPKPTIAGNRSSLKAFLRRRHHTRQFENGALSARLRFDWKLPGTWNRGTLPIASIGAKVDIALISAKPIHVDELMGALV